MSPVNARNILLHELIGLETKVIKDSNPSNRGVSGIVIDETRKTLVLRGDGKTAHIAKRNLHFQPSRRRIRGGWSSPCGAPRGQS